MKSIDKTFTMRQLYRNDYIIDQFKFLEQDYHFIKKEVLRLNYTPDTKWEKFSWERCDVTVEIIHKYDALPWTVVYKKMEYDLIKFTESNSRMGLSTSRYKPAFRNRLCRLFNRLTEEDFKHRVDFLRDELSCCIEDILAY